MLHVGAVVQALIPPTLHAVIIVYRPGDPAGAMSSVIAGETENTPEGHAAALARAKLAAGAFVAQPANNPGFKGPPTEVPTPGA